MKKNKYIDEAKVRDVIPQYMQNILVKKHGDKVLDLEVPEKNPVIPNIKKEITDQNLLSVIKEQIIQQNSKNIIEQLRKTKYAKSEIIDYLIKIKVLTITNSEDDITIENARKIFSKEYFLIKNFETLEISNNKTSLYNFLTHCEKNNFKLPYTSQDLKAEEKTINGIVNAITNLLLITNNNKLKKAYIYITDQPIDILNMSISCFFNSCQNLYNGSHNQKLTNNIFDKNMKVCYIIYDESFIDQAGNKINYTPLSRNIIRYIKNIYDTTGEFYLDRTYGVLNTDLIKDYINSNLDFKVTTQTSETYHGTSVKGMSLPYLDNGLKAKFSSLDGSEILNNTFEQALGNFLNVEIINEPKPNVYEDDEDNVYEVYEHDALIDSYYRDNSYSYYNYFAKNKQYINNFLDNLEWNEDNIRDNFDYDEISDYISDNLSVRFDDINLFSDILYNEKIFNINDIIKVLYQGNKQDFINDLKKYKEINLDKGLFPFEYLTYYNKKIPYPLYELLNKRYYFNYENKNEIENEFYLKEKENIFYEIRLPGPSNDFFIKNLLYIGRGISKKENDSIIMGLCDKINKLYKNTFYFEKRNILVDRSGKLSEYIYQLNIYLYKKRNKYKIPTAFYLSYIFNSLDILNQEYIELLKEKMKEIVMKGDMINIINDYVTELYGYSNLIQYIDFTGNSSKYEDYINELVKETIYNYSGYDMLNNESIYGDFEYENKTYYVTQYKGY